MMLKYQDDILMLVKKKVEAAKTKKKHKKKAEHIILEDGVKAASNPEAPVPSKSKELSKMFIQDKPKLVLVDGELPNFKIKVGKDKSKNSSFVSTSFMKKTTLKSEFKSKIIHERLSNISQTQLSIL